MTTLSKYLYNLLFILSNILFPVITFSYAARVLGPEGIGKVQVVLNFAQYFVLVAALGIPTYGLREVAKVSGDPEKLSKLFSELLTINLLMTLLLLIPFSFLLSTLPQLQPDNQLYWLSGLLVLTGFMTIDWFYTGTEQFRYLSLRSVIIKAVSLVALFLFVRSPEGLIIYLLINILTVMVTNIWNLFNLPVKIRIRFRNLELRKHFSGLTILFLITLAVSVYTLADVLILRIFTDNQSVGFYTAAIKINKILIPVITTLGVVLMPQITQCLAAGDRTTLRTLTERSFAYICLLAIPISAGLLVFAPEIMILFSGVGFEGAVPAMQISAALAILIGLGHLFGLQLLIPGGYEKKYLLATLAGMAVSLTINLLLIPVWKERGAALAMVISEVMVTGASFWFVSRIFSLRFNWTLILKSLAACLVFIPVALLLRETIDGLLLRLIIAVLACAGLYFLIQVAVFRDRHVREAALLVTDNFLR